MWDFIFQINLAIYRGLTGIFAASVMPISLALIGFISYAVLSLIPTILLIDNYKKLPSEKILIVKY